MKFGKTLEATLLPVWRYNYIDYTALKKQLKASSHTEQDEARFLSSLEKELEKIKSFRKLKKEEIQRRLHSAELKFDSLIKNNSSNEEEFSILETELETLLSTFHSLQEYSRLNFTGFHKILKKHDRRTSYQITPMFNERLQNARLYETGVDKSSFRISELLARVKNRGNQSPASLPDSSAIPKNVVELFERNTKKFWVHHENLVDLEYLIIKYLPPVRHTDGSDEVQMISSVYLDNINFDLYVKRLERVEGAEAIRIRWYGQILDDTKEVYIERKIHHSNNSQPTKERFSILDSKVSSFLNGAYTATDLVAYHRSVHSITDSEANQLFALASEIQNTVISQNLKPVIRTVYNRVAFQVGSDSRIRVSLDSDIIAIREIQNDEESGKSWRRLDTDLLGEDEIHRFKYAVLEVKIHDIDTPEWVTSLENNHMVKEYSKFSKFVHAVATLFETRVNALPFWLTDIERDFWKPVTLDKETQMRFVQQFPILQRPSRLFNPSQVEPDDGGSMWKRIVLPSRIEPKVYLANERTFLSWMHYGLVLSALAVGLINFGDGVGVTAGLMFTAVSLIFMTYAVYLYSWRNHKIKVKDQTPFDDLWGPTVLVGTIYVAAIINLYLKYSHM